MRTAIIAAVLALCASSAAAQPQPDPYFTRYGENADQQAAAPQTDEYKATQALDGIGAMFIGVGEPAIFRPSLRIQQCVEGSSGGAAVAAVPFCGLYGVVEGVFFCARDVMTGAGDLLTGGYFKLSRRAGVYDNLK